MLLKEKYNKEVVSKFKEKYGYKNNLMAPKIEKVVVSIGVNRAISEKNKDYLKWLENTLRQITGQNPVVTLAKESISNFKIREGVPVGLKVTLRGRRMYDFLDKLINIALPRGRDSRGIREEAIDKQGNLSLGFQEQVVFPEINPAEAPCTHGFEVSVVTTAFDRQKAKDLLELCGFPFSQISQK